MEEIKKRYLGDGVYAAFDGYQIWLHTGSCAIALDPQVFSALLDYAEGVFNSQKEQSDGGSDS